MRVIDLALLAADRHRWWRMRGFRPVASAIDIRSVAQKVVDCLLGVRQNPDHIGRSLSIFDADTLQK